MKRALASLAILFVIACGSIPPGPIGTTLNVYQLKFKVMDAVGIPAYCDPDFYPVVREGGEQANAIAEYPKIRAQADLYTAILAHEHLAGGDTDAQKLTIYRAYKLQRAVPLTQNGDEYDFEFRSQWETRSLASPVSMPKSDIVLVKGTVRIDGVVNVTSNTPSGPPPCPICLAANTLIATPTGEVRVIDVKAGMLVWTALQNGKREAARVVEVASTAVPAGHRMVRLRLADGRELLASPGHRTADGRAVGSLAIGDSVDGSTVVFWDLVPYSGERTYDLLPAGSTGMYWANGILLASTLTR